MTVTALGIRHHGPGSARSVLAALDGLDPDCVLVEGPADVGDALALAARDDMRPPVALLAYHQAEPSRAVYYPYAEFSPEWQAIRWALARDVDVRFIDLPAKDTLAEYAAEEEGDEGEAPQTPELVRDPLTLLATSAGYDDPERWWEDMVEHRGAGDTFAAIAEAMGELRAQLGAQVATPHEQRREHHMVTEARRARDEGREHIAVVCGAWHAPVFEDLDRRMPRPPAGPRAKGKTAITWVPWTYSRLASGSGYGAGVQSPAWYEHLFAVDDEPAVRWLGRAAEVLRREDTDISTAHVIEATRTAGALSALRGRPLPGLPELLDALRAVLGEDAETQLSLLRDELIIGRQLGEVAADVPVVPLQRDLEAQQKTLRMKPQAAAKALELDLRKPNDLARSLLLHRLALLGLPWGVQSRSQTANRGTFREAWTLEWHPEFAVRLVEASAWGSTVASAATARVRDRAAAAGDLGALTGLLEACLLADLPDGVEAALVAFEAKAALTTDVAGLMGGLPALARAARYGSVRKTDTASLDAVVSELVARIGVGLPPAAAGIDDDAAADLLGHVDAVADALGVLDDDALREVFDDALRRLGDRPDTHPLLAGRATRMRLDARAVDAEDAARRMSRQLSPGTKPVDAAAWLEGFLSGSALAVIHDPALLALVDDWLAGADGAAFEDVLPVLRRTFSTFTAAERRQVGERVRQGTSTPASAFGPEELDEDRVVLVMPALQRLLEATR